MNNNAHSAVRVFCRPEFFAVEETDPQNLYMDPGHNTPPDYGHSMKQHANLTDTIYRNMLGIDVCFVKPVRGLTDMTFVANLWYIEGNKALMAYFKPTRRRGETPAGVTFCESLGYEIFMPPQRPSKRFFFEGGGDVIPYGDTILLGHGPRTDKRAQAWIEKITGKEVIPLELEKRHNWYIKQYHLDTAILAFEKQKKFILYPKAFSLESLARLEKIGDICAVEYHDVEMLELNGDIIDRSEMSLDAQKNLSSEWTGAVVLPETPNLRVQEIIRGIGYEPIPVPLDQFRLSGGGPGCLRNNA